MNITSLEQYRKKNAKQRAEKEAKQEAARFRKKWPSVSAAIDAIDALYADKS